MVMKLKGRDKVVRIPKSGNPMSMVYISVPSDMYAMVLKFRDIPNQ